MSQANRTDSTPLPPPRLRGAEARPPAGALLGLPSSGQRPSEQSDLLAKLAPHLPALGAELVRRLNRAHRGPNARRALALLLELCTLRSSRAVARERLTPELVTALLTAVAEPRNTDAEAKEAALGPLQTL